MLSDTSVVLRYQANKRSAGVAYVLWFIAGGLGAHRFYAGKPKTALLQVVMLIVALFSFFNENLAVLGVILCSVLFLWEIIDLFLIPGMIRDSNNSLVTEMEDIAARGKQS